MELSRITDFMAGIIAGVLETIFSIFIALLIQVALVLIVLCGLYLIIFGGFRRWR